MKITFFIGSLKGGGAERVVCNLSNYLSKNHDITILTMSDVVPAYHLDAEVNILPLTKGLNQSNKIVINFYRILSLFKYVKKANPDIYIVMLPVTINLLLCFRKFIKSPIIISERGDPKIRHRKSRILKWIDKYLYSKANGYVFQTNDVQNYYNSFIGKSGCIIPNAVSENFISQDFNDFMIEKKIVSVGRFTDQKNFPLLIHAFANISASYPEYKLEIYGEGHLRIEYEKLIRELNIESRVSMPGYINNLQENIRNSEIFVLPSNYEGMPNALIEAMSLGIPSIATDCPVGGPAYLINNNENGLLIPVNGLNELTESLKLLINDDNLRLKLKTNSKEIANYLHPDKVYDAWELYIIEVIKKYR